MIAKSFGRWKNGYTRPPVFIRRNLGAVRYVPVDIRSYWAADYLPLPTKPEKEGQAKFTIVWGNEIDAAEEQVRQARFLPPEPYRPHGFCSALYEIAWYLRREEGYDFVPYGSLAEAWVWELPSYYSTSDRYLLGAAMFEWFEGEPWLMWVWLHPAYRRKGFLTEQFKTWQSVYGEFKIQGPYSEGFAKFIDRVQS